MTWSKCQLRLLFLTMACAVAGLGAIGWLCMRSPNIAFLPAQKPAEWIVYPTPANGLILPIAELSTEFRRSFSVEKLPATAKVFVRSFKRYGISINGNALSSAGGESKNWKDAVEHDIAALLRLGTNEIAVTVYNSNGPPALWMAIEGSGFSFFTDETWEASYAGATWKNARLATTSFPIKAGNRMYATEKPLASLVKHAWFYLTLTVVATMAVILLERLVLRWRKRDSSQKFSVERLTEMAVFGLVAMWVILWSNNIGVLPAQLGFDAQGHLDYIQYILNHHALPFANHGWEMFQPPLYYLFSAIQLYLVNSSTLEGGGLFMLRLFAMLFGITTIILVFLSLRLVFPGQLRKQWLGLFLVGLLPENIYLCLYTTNEIPAGTLAALAVYLCLRIIRNPEVSLLQHVMVGVAMGAALLTKTTTIVLPPVIMLALTWNLLQKGRKTPRFLLPCLGSALVCCVIVSGWHYARVAAHFGRPFVGDWDPESGFAWWQHPGYQTFSYYSGFGHSLIQPFYSVFASFGDGYYSTLWGDGLYGGNVSYRPPWNYDLMAAGYLFAIVPALGMLLGLGVVIVQFIREPRVEMFLLLGVTILMGSFLVYFSLKIPIYAVVKSFYGLGALVPLCAFGALGLDMVVQRAGKLRYVLYVFLGVWGLNVWGSFWIHKNGEETQLWLADLMSAQGLHEEASARLSELAKNNPRNPVTMRLMALQLFFLGHPEQAKTMAEETVKLAPEDMDAHIALGWILAHDGNLEGAASQAKLALKSGPDDARATSKLAQWLGDAGRKDEAISAYREAVRTDPSGGDLHYHLALAESGKPAEALTQYRFAVELQPKSSEFHDNFGLALLSGNQFAEAGHHFEEAIKLSPQNAIYYFHLGVGLGRMRKATEAAEQYREALRLDPKQANALNDLAWILATDKDPKLRNGAEAVEKAKQACELTDRKMTRFIETLAVAYAEAGRFDEATATIRQELELAQTAGDAQRVKKASQLLELFNEKHTYHEEAPSNADGKYKVNRDY